MQRENYFLAEQGMRTENIFDHLYKNCRFWSEKNSFFSHLKNIFYSFAQKSILLVGTELNLTWFYQDSLT